MKKHLVLTLSLLFFSGAVCFSYFKSGLDGLPAFWKATGLLEQLLVYNNAIEREALLLANGRRVTFDHMAAVLKTTSRFIANESLGAELTSTMASKLEQTERFKERLAVYRNAARNSIQVIYRMNSEDILKQLTPEERAVEGALSRAVLSRLSIRDELSKSNMQDTLLEVSGFQFSSEVAADEWAAMLRHAYVLEESSEDVHQLLIDITDDNLEREVRTQYDTATEIHHEAAAQANRWRLVLLSNSLILILLLFRAVQLALRHSTELKKFNDRLEFLVKERTEVLENTTLHLREVIDENQAQQRSLTRLSEALVGAKEGVMVLEGDHTVLFANDAYANMFDYDLGQLIGNTHPPSQHTAKILSISKMQDPSEQDDFDLSLNSAQGDVKTLEFSVGTIANEQQHAPEYLVIARDVSERRKLESQLAQAQKLESVGQLAAGIAHEINTPTQYASNNLQFMGEAWDDIEPLFDHLNAFQESGDLDPNSLQSDWEKADMAYLREEVPLALNQARSGLEQIANIVLAMKNFAHPGAENLEATDVNAAIRDTITIAKSEWKYVADVETDFDDTAPPIPAVRSALNQVWLNLIVNSAHAIENVVGGSDSKGKIQISTRVGEDSLIVKFKDSGSGIPEDIQAKVFDPFFTTKSVGKGSGQGLAIARSVITDQHRGHISLISSADQGTEFTIKLPLERNEESLQQAG